MLQQMTVPVQGGIRQQKKLELVANHLANAGTNGFKADILTFDHMLNAKVAIDLRPGDLKTTGNKLDLAIAKGGFFEIQTGQGPRYTRDGNFTLNSEGELVTQSGYIVAGEGGAITIEGKEIDIDEKGEVKVDGEVVDNLKIVNFRSSKYLKKEGSSLYRYTGSPANMIIPEDVSVKQGTLEMPNFKTVVEMTKLIEIQRIHEAYQKMIHSFDEMDTKAINEVGKLQ